jgi:hypothetical protein
MKQRTISAAPKALAVYLAAALWLVMVPSGHIAVQVAAFSVPAPRLEVRPLGTFSYVWH